MAATAHPLSDSVNLTGNLGLRLSDIDPWLTVNYVMYKGLANLEEVKHIQCLTKEASADCQTKEARTYKVCRLLCHT